MSTQELVNRLNDQPTLIAHIESMLDIVENQHKAMNCANSVEARIVEQSRLLNQEILSTWGRNQAARQAAEFSKRHPSLG